MGIKHMFNYDGFCTDDHGIVITGGNVFKAPVRKVNTVSVPGRNGSLHFDEGNYENVDIEYKCGITADMIEKFPMIRNELATRSDRYYRLEDTLDPDVFRMARFCGTVEPDINTWLTGGRFSILFDCKPQKFLKVGDEVIQIMSMGHYIENPEKSTAKPLIRVYGSGTLQVGSYTVEILQHDQPYMDIDCELMDAFCGAVNLNNKLVLTSGTFPTLPAGETRIMIPVGITEVDITPRWWRL